MKRLGIRQVALDALGPRPPWYRLSARRAWNRRRAAIMAMDVSKYAEMIAIHYSPEHVELAAQAERPLFRQLTKSRP